VIIETDKANFLQVSTEKLGDLALVRIGHFGGDA